MYCHATDGPPKMGPPDHLWQIMLLWMVPWTKYGCHRWSPRTICGAVSGPPLPQMVPLKLSLEMMSRGSYQVNLANMDGVIIIIIYFHYALLHAVAIDVLLRLIHTQPRGYIATVNCKCTV